MDDDWPIHLFKKSVLKQRKFKEVSKSLGPTEGLHCLDIGGDNGVISYLLRKRGGSWKSGDLDEQRVRAIQALVGSEVYCLDGSDTPFASDEFDRVAIVDSLEHLPQDAEFMAELQRVLKPGGLVVVNVPYLTRASMTEAGRRTARLLPHLETCIITPEALDIHAVVYIYLVGKATGAGDTGDW